MNDEVFEVMGAGRSEEKMVKNSKPSRVVIVGAGFGGLWAAKELDGTAADVVLIDRNNYHTFYPLLYQIAAAEIAPEEIAYPVRGTLRKSKNVRFVLGPVESVDLYKQTVSTTSTTSEYDYLIVACGSVTNFFKVKGAAEHAFPLRELDQSIALRNHILRCFERAATEQDPRQRAVAHVCRSGRGADGCGVQRSVDGTRFEAAAA